MTEIQKKAKHTKQGTIIMEPVSFELVPHPQFWCVHI